MKSAKPAITALVLIVLILGASYYVTEYNKKRAAERRAAQEQIKALVARLTGPTSTPAPYFTEPGDVTIVTDGNDFRLQLRGGTIGSEVFATKQQALDYINQMHKILNPAEGKDYRPAP